MLFRSGSGGDRELAGDIPAAQTAGVGSLRARRATALAQWRSVGCGAGSTGVGAVERSLSSSRSLATTTLLVPPLFQTRNGHQQYLQQACSYGRSSGSSRPRIHLAALLLQRRRPCAGLVRVRLREGERARTVHKADRRSRSDIKFRTHRANLLACSPLQSLMAASRKLVLPVRSVQSLPRHVRH